MIRCREYRRTSSTVSSAAGVTSGGNDTDILPGRPTWAGTASWLWTLLVPRDVNQAAGPGIPGRRPGHSRPSARAFRAVGPVKCHRFGVQLMTCRSQPRPPAIGRRPQHRCGRRCCRSCLTWAGHPTRAGRCPTRRRSAGSRCPIPRRPTTTSSGPQASPATQPHTGPATQLQASPATQLRQPGDTAPGQPGDTAAGQQPDVRAGRPDPRTPDVPPDGGWPGKFAQVLAETLAGSRPPRQIVPWTSEQARRHIRQLGPMMAAGERPLVRRVVASRPAAGVVEMTVVVRFGPRVRALAVRLERDGPRRAGPGRDARPARWRCTAVEAA